MSAPLPRDPAADVGVLAAEVASLLEALPDVDDPATDLDDVAARLAQAHGMLSDALDTMGREVGAASTRP